MFCVPYLAFVLLLSGSEIDRWDSNIAGWGIASLFMILFPESSRIFVSRLTIDNLTPANVTSGLGWALLVIWAIMMSVILLVYIF